MTRVLLTVALAWAAWRTCSWFRAEARLQRTLRARRALAQREPTADDLDRLWALVRDARDGGLR